MVRPIKLKTKDPDELEALVEDYFDSLWTTRKFFPRNGDPYEEEWQRPATMAGLARHLGVTRVTLWRYQHRGDDLADVLKPVIARAMDRLAERAEEATFDRELHNGGRFALEVNHRYGKEGEGAGGTGFNQVVVAPQVEEDQPLAIPKWDDD